MYPGSVFIVKYGEDDLFVVDFISTEGLFVTGEKHFFLSIRNAILNKFFKGFPFLKRFRKKHFPIEEHYDGCNFVSTEKTIALILAYKN